MSTGFGGHGLLLLPLSPVGTGRARLGTVCALLLSPCWHWVFRDSS